MSVIMKLSKHWPLSWSLYWCSNITLRTVVLILYQSMKFHFRCQQFKLSSVHCIFKDIEFKTVVLFCINQWNFIPGVNNYRGSNLITGLIVTSVFILLALIIIIICLLLKNFVTKHGILRLREEREDHQMKSM